MTGSTARPRHDDQDRSIRAAAWLETARSSLDPVVMRAAPWPHGERPDRFSLGANLLVERRYSPVRRPSHDDQRRFSIGGALLCALTRRWLIPKAARRLRS